MKLTSRATAGVLLHVASAVAGGVLFGTSSAASLAGQDRPVDRHAVEYSDLPGFHQGRSGGFANPFVGNGDVAMALDVSHSGPPKGRRVGPDPDGNQALVFGKNDYWISDAGTYFSHLAAARLDFDLPTSPNNYSAAGKMDIGSGTLSWQLAPKQGALPSLNASSIIGESDNVVITSITCNASGPACPIDVTLRDTSGNAHQLQSYAGVDHSRSVACQTNATATVFAST